jgi:hypothetical protein
LRRFAKHLTDKLVLASFVFMLRHHDDTMGN